MIENLYIKDFRSYKEKKISFSKKTNIILGKNGAGKTNIIEAILLLCIGKSYRARENDIIKYESKISILKGVFDGKQRSLVLQKDQKKQFNIKNKKVSRINFNQTIPTVLFEPDFTQIINRGPDIRRDYIDGVLSKILPNYSTLLSRYKRTLTQRNNLLKSNNFSKEEIFVWNLKISELGGEIVKNRQNLIENINLLINDIYSEIANKKTNLQIEYKTILNLKNYSDSLIKSLEKNIKIDKIQGFTSTGPHREDVEFYINEKNTKTSSSRGEIRTLLLTLKIIETKLIEEARGEPPILLLDDVFSELDETRQSKLVEFFYKNQVIITTTTITPLMHGVDGKIIEI